MRGTIKGIAAVAALVVVLGVVLSWYHIDFSRALSLVRMVSPSEAQKLQSSHGMSSASRVLTERGVQLLAGQVALVAAGLALATLAIATALEATRERAAQAFWVVFGSGAVAVSAALWGLSHKPDAAHLIDRLVDLPMSSLFDKALEGVVGLGGLASLGTNSLYPVATGVGLSLTLVGGLVLTACGLALALMRVRRPRLAPQPTAATAAAAAAAVVPTPASAPVPAGTAFCSACGRRFTDDSLTFCPECGAPRA